MSVERKKVELKPINKLEPKKRIPLPETVIEEIPTEVPTLEEEVIQKEVVKKVKSSPKQNMEIVIDDEQKEVRQRAKPSDNKYVRLCMEAKSEERKEFNDKVKNGELKMAFYSVEGDNGYHYYLVMKK